MKPPRPNAWIHATREASDITTPNDRLAEFATHPSLAHTIAANPNTPFETFTQIAKQHARAAIRNPMLELYFVANPSKHDTLLDQIETNATRAPNLTDLKGSLPNDHTAYANPHLTTHEITTLLHERYANDPTTLEHLAQNPGLSATTLTRLAQHPNPLVRYHATRNPSLDPDTLLAEAQHAHAHALPHTPALLAALATRPDTPPSVRQRVKNNAGPGTFARLLLENDEPTTTPAPATPRTGGLAKNLTTLRHELLTAHPSHDRDAAEAALRELALDPTAHPATRARAALTTRAILEEVGESLLRVLPPGERTHAIAAYLEDDTAMALVRYQQRVGTRDSTLEEVAVPF